MSISKNIIRHFAVRGQTIQQAEAAGWQGLALYCGRCRRQTVQSWAFLRSRTAAEKLADVFLRCRCHLCGRTPSIAKLAVEVPCKEGGSWLREKRIEFIDGTVRRPSRE